MMKEIKSLSMVLTMGWLMLSHCLYADKISYTENFNDCTIYGSYTGTHIYSRTWVDWNVIYGTATDMSAVKTTMGSNAIILQPRTSVNNAMLISTKVLAVDSISLALATTNNVVTYTISYSNDSISWSDLVTNATFGVRDKKTVKYALPSRQAIYLRITAASSNVGSLYRLYVDDITFYCTALPPTLSAETLYVSSMNDIATTSSMTLQVTDATMMSGTLTITNAVGGEGGSFTAVIDDAVVTRSGINTAVRIAYTPIAANISETATMTATINGLSTDFVVEGRSLPNEFVVVSSRNAIWSSLPHDKSPATTEGYAVELNDYISPISATLAADSAIYRKKDWQTATKQWRTNDNRHYGLYDPTALAGNGGYVYLNRYCEWTMSESEQDGVLLLPVMTIVEPAPIRVTEWKTNEIQFTAPQARGIDNYDSLQVWYHNKRYSVIGALPQTTNGLYTLAVPDLNLSAYPAERLQIKWYKAGAVEALTDMLTPLFVEETSTNISGLSEEVLRSTDVSINTGETLTIDASLSVRDLTVKAGATLKVTEGATLRVRRLQIESGLYNQDDERRFDVPRIYIADGSSLIPAEDTIRLVYRVSADNYFPLSVPFSARLSDMRYLTLPDESLTGHIGTAVNIASFDGEARGAGEETETKYWQPLAAMDNLSPATGYILSAKRLKGE